MFGEWKMCEKNQELKNIYFISDPAEIIQSRYNEQENHFEYYVHYEGSNRRLDEWVPRDRIMSSRFDMSEQRWKSSDRNSKDMTDGLDRKITRNQKRRHDEINHIQKVCHFFFVFVIQMEHNLTVISISSRRMLKWTQQQQL